MRHIRPTPQAMTLNTGTHSVHHSPIGTSELMTDPIADASGTGVNRQFEVWCLRAAALQLGDDFAWEREPTQRF